MPISWLAARLDTGIYLSMKTNKRQQARIRSEQKLRHSCNGLDDEHKLGWTISQFIKQEFDEPIYQIVSLRYEIREANTHFKLVIGLLLLIVTIGLIMVFK